MSPSASGTGGALRPPLPLPRSRGRVLRQTEETDARHRGGRGVPGPTPGPVAGRPLQQEASGPSPGGARHRGALRDSAVSQHVSP